MNLTVERSALLAVLTQVAGSVGKKATIPILNHVLLTADGNHVTITANNLDMQATVVAAADVQTPGSVAAPADVLLNIARNAAEGSEISLNLDGRLIVKSGRSRFSVSVLPTADFPQFGDMPEGQTFALSGVELDALVSRVDFAASDNASYYFMCGVNLFHDGTVLGACATDGKRLALAERAFDGLTPFSAIIPTPLVNEIGKACAVSKLDAEITVAPGKFRLVIGETTIIGKLINGTFPEFRRVIPVDLPNRLLVERAALDLGVKRVMVAIDDAARSCKLTIGAGSIKLSSRGQGLDARDEIESDYHGPETTIGANSMQLLQACAGCGSEQVELSFATGDDPFTVTDPDDSSFVAVIMPLRV